MSKRAVIIGLCSIVLVFTFMNTSVMASDRLFDDEIVLADLTPFTPSSSEDLADALKMDVETLESIENIYLVTADGEAELIYSLTADDETETGITPYRNPLVGENFPGIPGLQYYWVESDWSKTFVHFPTFDTPSLIPRTRFASGDDSFVLFNLNGTWCSFLGNGYVGWETGIHNPIDQINSLDVYAFWIDTFDNVYTVNSSSLYNKILTVIIPTNYSYRDKYADFFILSGQDLYIHELSPVFYYAGKYICEWDSIGEASYYPPTQVYEHIVRVIL